MPDKLISDALMRIENNQTQHAAATDLRLQGIEKSVSSLVTQQVSDDKTLSDHENRIRKNETVIVKVTTFFTGASVIFGSVVAWAVDKLLGGAP